MTEQPTTHDQRLAAIRARNRRNQILDEIQALFVGGTFVFCMGVFLWIVFG